MLADREYDHRKNHPGAWVTIGSFDGVHLGHQAIISKLVEESHQNGDISIVVTFFPHPVRVLRDNKDPYYLTSPEEKNQLLRTLGVDSILTLRFNHSLASKSADSFIRILHEQLKFSCLLIGYDFRLGANRSGDIHTLSELGKELGYCVKAIEPFTKTSQAVSSSSIRELIQSGDVATANEWLGRPYSVQGKIIHGDGRGKHIGLPTANLNIWQEKLLPGVGVYAAFADLENSRYLSVVNIGNRPTFYEQPFQQTVEAHLLDFDQDIYEQNLRLSFIQRIRPEIKFDSAQKLMNQINQDIQLSREVLTHELNQKNLPA
jgi:riboflavin kinase/FMN adenylyltransferase